MGTIRNEMTIVHHWKKDELEKVREDAIKFLNELENGISDQMVSPIMTSYINGEYTFVINGDCSKIGWETSERFHEARIEWCKNHYYKVQNIIVINFGEGEPCCIVFDSKAESEDNQCGERVSSKDEKDIRCGKCVHWRSYEVCNHWKERRCESKDSPYYLHDTDRDTQCAEFRRSEEVTSND